MIRSPMYDLMKRTVMDFALQKSYIYTRIRVNDFELFNFVPCCRVFFVKYCTGFEISCSYSYK